MLIPSLLLFKALCHLQRTMLKKKKKVWKTKGKGLYCTSLKGSFQDSSLSFSQRNWMAPLISSEMWWITKLSSGYPTERWMPRGRNGELELAVPFPAWDELWLHVYLHHTWTHLSVTSPCLCVTRLCSPRFVVQAPSPYKKSSICTLGHCFSVEIVWQTSLQRQQWYLC